MDATVERKVNFRVFENKYQLGPIISEIQYAILTENETSKTRYKCLGNCHQFSRHTQIKTKGVTLKSFKGKYSYRKLYYIIIMF